MTTSVATSPRTQDAAAAAATDLAKVITQPASAAGGASSAALRPTSLANRARATAKTKAEKIASLRSQIGDVITSSVQIMAGMPTGVPATAKSLADLKSLQTQTGLVAFLRNSIHTVDRTTDVATLEAMLTKSTKEFKQILSIKAKGKPRAATLMYALASFRGAVGDADGKPGSYTLSDIDAMLRKEKITTAPASSPKPAPKVGPGRKLLQDIPTLIGIITNGATTTADRLTAFNAFRAAVENHYRNHNLRGTAELISPVLTPALLSTSRTIRRAMFDRLSVLMTNLVPSRWVYSGPLWSAIANDNFFLVSSGGPAFRTERRNAADGSTFEGVTLERAFFGTLFSRPARPSERVEAAERVNRFNNLVNNALLRNTNLAGFDMADNLDATLRRSIPSSYDRRTIAGAMLYIRNLARSNLEVPDLVNFLIDRLGIVGRAGLTNEALVRSIDDFSSPANRRIAQLRLFVDGNAAELLRLSRELLAQVPGAALPEFFHLAAGAGPRPDKPGKDDEEGSTSVLAGKRGVMATLGKTGEMSLEAMSEKPNEGLRKLTVNLQDGPDASRLMDPWKAVAAAGGNLFERLGAQIKVHPGSSKVAAFEMLKRLHNGETVIGILQTDNSKPTKDAVHGAMMLLGISNDQMKVYGDALKKSPGFSEAGRKVGAAGKPIFEAMVAALRLRRAILGKDSTDANTDGGLDYAAAENATGLNSKTRKGRELLPKTSFVQDIQGTAVFGKTAKSKQSNMDLAKSALIQAAITSLVVGWKRKP